MLCKKYLKRIWDFDEDIKDEIMHWRSQRGQKSVVRALKRMAVWGKSPLSGEQKQQIDEFYVKNYGEKIDYDSHQCYTAYTGNFDVKYFPETLYIPEFEHYENLNVDYANVLTDKNFLPHIAKSVGVEMPKTILSRVFGMFMMSNRGGQTHITSGEALNCLRNIGEAFVKPSVDTNSGVGCYVVNIQNGYDQLSRLSVEQLLGQFGNNFSVQERLKCHESIAKIYDGSVNTFRIITYRWHDNIHAMPVIMRIGRDGNYLDNAHAGGVFIAVDNDGLLHDFSTTEFCEKYEKHPTTGFIYKGHKIDLIPKVLEAAKKMHEAVPQLGSCNWDFTIDDKGSPVLIEANTMNGGIWLTEMAHGKGPFGDRTAEILQWMSLMKKTAYSKRKLYMFGKM